MNMTMTYDGTMVMPKNYAVVTEDEMTYVDGGFDPVTVITGAIASGWAAIEIGKSVGAYVYNSGGGRFGTYMALARTSGIVLLGNIISLPYILGLDMGWLAASKSKA